MATIDRTVGTYHDSSNARIRKIGRYVGPASYANPGGDPVTANQIGLGRIEAILFGIAWDGADAVRLLVYDPATSSIKWFVPNTDAEVANGVDLSGFSTRFEAIGY